MLQVQGVTEDAFQVQNLTLESGEVVTLSLVYSPMQLGWFMDISYKTFELLGFRVHTSPNMLHQYKSQLPFGLALFTSDGAEPTQQQDFLAGYAIIYILTTDEVAEYEAILSG